MIEIDLLKKHGKKALGMDHPPKPTWRERLPEILLEIGIIVFAITLSIQLHSWHEHALDREAERAFLAGLREDLRDDLREMREDSLAYVAMQRGFRYFSTLTPTSAYQPDSVRHYAATLNSTSILVPNASRFEALKSTGRLGIIEDPALQTAILALYQQAIPSLLSVSTGFSQFKQDKMQSYLDEHYDPTQQNFIQIISAPTMKNYLNRQQVIGEILARYHAVMQQARSILARIERLAA